MRQSFVIAVLLVLAGCGSTEESRPSARGEKTTVPAVSYAIGETATAEGLDVTIKSVKSTNRVMDPMAVPLAEPDETYVVVEYLLKNTGTKPIELMEKPGLELVDAAGQVYARDEIASAAAGSNLDVNSMVAAMNPGVTSKNAAVWKVDKKSYDPATWKVVAQTDPELEFKLK